MHSHLDGLATAHCHDYFQFIAIRQLLRGKQTARNDFAVAFQRNAFAGQAHFFHEGSNAGRVGKLARCAVNADGNHFMFIVQLDQVRRS
jgi:hypothetical protein